jgi:hypothetical protein
MSLFGENNNRYIKEGQDFITQVADFIHKTTMTSYRWSECIATSMLSTVMGPERFIINVQGKLNLNVWYMCIGPSGLAHKTIPMKTYLIPILIKASELLPDKYHLVLPSKFSVEALIKFMKDHTLGCIIRDEFTGLLKESAGKDYLVDSLEFLSELYDGLIQKRSTIAHGTQELAHVFVTFVTATTPYLYKVMKPDFYTQGTGNRINIEMFHDSDIPEAPINPEEYFKGRVFETQRDNFIEEVATILKDMRHCTIKYIQPDEEAGKLWADYKHECTLIAKKHYKANSYDLHYSYLARSAETALKLSGLYAMSRRWNIIIAEEYELQEVIILKQDMQRAIDKAKHHYQQFCLMLDAWRLRPDQANVRTYEEQASFLLDQIVDHPEGRGWTEIRRNVKWDSQTWKEVLKYLYQSEKIIVVQGESRGGRKPILLHEYKPDFECKGVRLDWRLISDFLNL